MASPFGPVDPSDSLEIRPSLEGITDDDVEEVNRRYERRKASRKDRITKKYGAREAELDAADDVVPVREVPLWYALKVSARSLHHLMS